MGLPVSSLPPHPLPTCLWTPHPSSFILTPCPPSFLYLTPLPFVTSPFCFGPTVLAVFLWLPFKPSPKRVLLKKDEPPKGIVSFCDPCKTSGLGAPFDIDPFLLKFHATYISMVGISLKRTCRRRTCRWTYCGRLPAPPRNSCMRILPENRSKQWFRMVSNLCRISSIHSSSLNLVHKIPNEAECASNPPPCVCTGSRVQACPFGPKDAHCQVSKGKDGQGGAGTCALNKKPTKTKSKEVLFCFLLFVRVVSVFRVQPFWGWFQGTTPPDFVTPGARRSGEASALAQGWNRGIFWGSALRGTLYLVVF